MKLTSYINVEGSYGGHQLWWGKGTIGHHFGCGVMAGLDGLLYRGIVGSRTMSRGAYMDLAEELWAVMRPNTGPYHQNPQNAYKGLRGIGVYSLAKFKRGMRNFVRSKGYKAQFRQLNNGRHWQIKDHNLTQAIKFIKEALREDQPVHLLSWNEVVEGYSFHWITITGIERQDGKTSLTIATWGTEKHIKDFDAFWVRQNLLDHKTLLTYALSKSL